MINLSIQRDRILILVILGLFLICSAKLLFVRHKSYLSWIGVDFQGLHLVRTSGEVFFVNHTNEAVSLNLDEEDPYLKLEYRNSDGAWERAQAHYVSVCSSDSLINNVVLPGEHRMLESDLPKSGKPATLRYSLYRQRFKAVSQEFEGFVNLKEVSLAKFDSIALSKASFERVVEIALGRLKPPYPVLQLNPRDNAILRLFDLATEDSRALEVLKDIARNECRSVSSPFFVGVENYGQFAQSLIDKFEQNSGRVPSRRYCISLNQSSGHNPTGR